MFNFKNYLNWPVAAAFLGAASLLASCDSAIYEDLPICENSRHAVRFVWDNNMLSSDAFRGNVHSVAVYGFDADDRLAFVLEENGDALKMQGYTLAIDVPDLKAGEYTLVAWCGLDNSLEDATRGESFILSDVEIGKTTREELICRMEREVQADGTHHSSEQLFDLFHGTAYGIEIFDKDDKENAGDHIYQINLTKDTNNVRIMLQQMNKDVKVDDFSFLIEDANGLLGPDNELQDDEIINYEPFNTAEGVAGTVEGTTRADGAIEGLGVAIADLKMSRLMARHESVLTIRNSDGSRVLQIPLTNYALLAKPYDAEGFTDQEYLDRQDNYRLMFFLDSQGEWFSSQININGWTIVNQDSQLNKDY